MAKKPWLVDLDMNNNEIQNVVAQNLSAAPSVKEGKFYWNTSDKKLYVYNGSQWVDATSQGSTYTFGTGLTETNDTVTLNQATTSSLGGVIIGSNITISSGTISVANASTSGKGVIEIATDTEASDGTATDLAVTPKQLATKVNKLSTGPAANTYTKVTVNGDGLVTAGASLIASDIPDLSGTYVPQTAIGSANGVAGLDGDGKVPSSQLPSYVDDVVDTYIVSGATPLSAGWLSLTDGGSALTPDTGIIYVVLTAGEYQNKTFRWSGSVYVEISSAPGQATESTPGIAAIATQAECTTGTNDTKIVTPLKLATYTAGMAKSFYASNGALTSSGGVCTWTITNTLAKKYVQVAVYEESTGDEVMTSVNVASGTITIKINSTSDIAANTYFAVIVG